MYLNCHSWFSFKYGALGIPRLMKSAQEKGITQFALTDINNTSGILEFVRESHKYGIKSVAGIDFRNGAQQQFIGIAKNNEGFLELNDFLSQHLHQDKPVIPATAPFFQHAFIIYPFSSQRDIRPLKEYEYIGVKPSDLNRLTFSAWKQWQNKLVILAPVTFTDKIDFNVHRLLRAIDNNTILSKLPKSEQTIPDEIFYTEQELERIYSQYPQLMYNTRRLMEQCSIAFEFGVPQNKKMISDSEEADRQQLRQLCISNIHYRYPDAGKDIYERMEKELSMIYQKGFTSYFLISYEIVNYARSKNYYYVGRGSGANSIVAYLLRITDVDPVDLDLYFERFINPYRLNPPDFDIDFSWKDRDDVISHIFNTYTNRHTCLLATYSTFQTKAVTRELGKVFGLPKNEIDALLNSYAPKSTDPIPQLIERYAQRLNDFPSHLSIHAGGILIAERPIHYYTATSMPPKGFPLSQFSMLEAEDVGLYKFDILSQRGLGHIKDTVEIVKRNRPDEPAIDIHDVKKFKADKRIQKRIQEANCIGCFYVESPGMRMLLTKLRVNDYLGLVAASSIIRPGVASSGMMRQYILCYRDPSKANYIHPKMRELMAETYGIMVYQEDVIKMAHEFAGLTLGEADLMRRGMSGKFRSRDEFARIRNKFFKNCKAKGIEYDVTKEVWRQTESFAGYSFSKGHSASYAVESYQSLFLKAYYPKEFMVGVINNEGGFYQKEFYVHEARMSGATIHAPDINKSEYFATIFGSDIYLGFRGMTELEEKSVEAIITERNRNGSFKDLADFTRRVSIAVEQIRILINVGAFRFTGRTKKQLLWDILMVMGGDKKTVARKELFEVPGKQFKLPPLFHHRINDAWDEIEILGFPLCSPFELIKEYTDNKTVAADFKNNLGKVVEIIGHFVNHKSTTTVKGDPMMFGTFLDRNGYFIDTTHFPNILAQYPLSGKGCYWIKGKVTEDFDFYSLDVISMKRIEWITRDDVAKEAIALNEHAEEMNVELFNS